MKLVDKKNKINRKKLSRMAQKMFGNLVKAVVDIEKEIIVIDAEMHVDEEAFLLENNSDQCNLWGINLYPEITDDGFIEFDSMVNLRPSQKNRSRGVDDPEIRRKIIEIIYKLVEK